MEKANRLIWLFSVRTCPNNPTRLVLICANVGILLVTNFDEHLLPFKCEHLRMPPPFGVEPCQVVGPFSA